MMDNNDCEGLFLIWDRALRENKEYIEKVCVQYLKDIIIFRDDPILSKLKEFPFAGKFLRSVIEKEKITSIVTQKILRACTDADLSRFGINLRQENARRFANESSKSEGYIPYAFQWYRKIGRVFGLWGIANDAMFSRRADLHYTDRGIDPYDLENIDPFLARKTENIGKDQGVILDRKNNSDFNPEAAFISQISHDKIKQFIKECEDCKGKQRLGGLQRLLYLDIDSDLKEDILKFSFSVPPFHYLIQDAYVNGDNGLKEHIRDFDKDFLITFFEEYEDNAPTWQRAIAQEFLLAVYSDISSAKKRQTVRALMKLRVSPYELAYLSIGKRKMFQKLSKTVPAEMIKRCANIELQNRIILERAQWMLRTAETIEQNDKKKVLDTDAVLFLKDVVREAKKLDAQGLDGVNWSGYSWPGKDKFKKEILSRYTFLKDSAEKNRPRSWPISTRAWYYGVEIPGVTISKSPVRIPIMLLMMMPVMFLFLMPYLREKYQWMKRLQSRSAGYGKKRRLKKVERKAKRKGVSLEEEPLQEEEYINDACMVCVEGCEEVEPARVWPKVKEVEKIEIKGTRESRFTAEEKKNYITSRKEMGYGDQAIEYLLNQPNLEAMENYSVKHRLYGSCDDRVWIYLKIDERGVITNATFTTSGCEGSQVAGHAVTTMIKGLTVDQAGEINEKDVLEHLGGLPAAKRHCACLVISTLLRTLKKYENISASGLVSKELALQWLNYDFDGGIEDLLEDLEKYILIEEEAMDVLKNEYFPYLLANAERNPERLKEGLKGVKGLGELFRRIRRKPSHRLLHKLVEDFEEELSLLEESSQPQPGRRVHGGFRIFNTDFRG